MLVCVFANDPTSASVAVVPAEAKITNKEFEQIAQKSMSFILE